MPDVFVAPKPHVSSPPNKRKVKLFDRPHKIPLLSQVFSSYLYQPSGIRFETQGDNEIIILFLRKHFITNFSWIAIGIILVISPLVIFPALMLKDLVSFSLPPSLISFFVLSWYLLTFSYIFVNFLLWYYDLSIVTNERVVDIDFQNILHKEVSATTINRIEDVTMKRGGFIEVLFDYGDIFIQTAGSEAEFGFISVPRPEKAVRIINQLMGKT